MKEKDKKALEVINKNPQLQSLLYDLDLLPEQLMPGTDKWQQMLNIVTAFMCGKRAQYDELSGG